MLPVTGRISVLGPVLLAGLFAASAAVHAADITLRNDALEITLAEGSGAIRQVRNLPAGLDLVTSSTGAAPWMLTLDSGTITTFTSFTATRDAGFPGDAYDLAWQTTVPGVSVAARVELPAGSSPAAFTMAVANTTTSRSVIAIEYPLVAGIAGLIGPAGTDRLAHPVAGGHLFRDPYVNFAADGRRRFYPDGYSGSPMQFLAYYRDDRGGFSLAAEDPLGTAKNVNFFKDPANGYLRMSLEPFSWDTTAGRGFTPGYTARLTALARGDWQEAADRYRVWALAQPWASEGFVRDKPDSTVARWLYGTVGLATFGVSLTMDQAAYFQALHDLLGGTPVFHISGFWWPGGTAASEWYGGYNDWGDSRVNAANLAKVRAIGDYWAPFLFDLHFSRTGNEWAHAAPNPASDPIAPWQPYEMIPDPESDPWAYICPATPQWQAFHGWRDTRLMELYSPDAAYYDIGPGLGRVRCDATTHGHTPGRGRWMIDGYRAMLASERAAINALKGRFVPQGTEVISELFLREFDFFQARAGGGVLSMLEGDEFRAGLKAGWTEKIPLWDFVYHDVGPVRLDGNLKVAPQIGNLFYWAAGKTVLEGALPELNYELSALERFPGIVTTYTDYETYQASFDVLDLSPYPLDTAKRDFLRDLSAARTGFAKNFLATGRMLRPARILAPVPPDVALDWKLYNTFQRNTNCSSGIETGQEFFETGTQTLPGLLQGAWAESGAAAPKRVGLGFVLLATASAGVNVEMDPARHGFDFLNYELRRMDASSDTSLGIRSGVSTASVTLPSRRVVFLTAAPAECLASSCQYRIYRSTAASGVLAPANQTALATGHSWTDPSDPPSMPSFFYLVDDGGGYPGASLRLALVSNKVRLDW